MIPFTFFPLQVAKVMWFSLGALSLIWGVRRLKGTLKNSGLQLSERKWLVITAFSTLIAFRFLENNFAQGQVNILFAFCSFAPLLFPPALGGFLLGIVAQMKLTPLAFVAYFIWKREWRVSAWAILGIAAASFLPALIHGPHYLLEQYQGWMMINKFHASPWMAGINNLSFLSWLSGIFGLWGGIGDRVSRELFSFSPATSKIIILSIVGAISSWMAFFTAKSGKNPQTLLWEYALVGLFAILFSPLSQKAQFSLIIYSAFITLSLSINKSKLVFWGWGIFAAVVWLRSYGIIGRQLTDLLQMWGIVPISLFLLFILLCAKNKIATSALRASSR